MDQTPNIFTNGSVWLRADFHLHTNADKEFLYSGASNDFLRQYIDQLVAQGIGIGVITNHNKFDKEQFKALKKGTKKQQIGLFPGIEFSLKEGIHILIVFDDPWYQGNTDHINEFLVSAFLGKANYNIPPYPNSHLDLAETVKILDQMKFDYFLVLAHPDDTNGLFEVLTARTKEDFVRQETFRRVLAMQKSGNLQNYRNVCEWAGRDIACVEGSDHAQGGIPAIGQGRKSYLKVGAFSFEAIKYALIDQGYRVRKETPPVIDNAFIKSIRLEGGLLNEKEIDFSPELNTLIGIRGSGKSSILEILRDALNIPLSAQVMDRDYKRGLIEHILKSGGKAVVSLVNENKEEYRIEKIYGQKADIYKDNILQPGITLDACFKSPAYFGQKDLSNKDIDFESHLIHSLIGTRLVEVQQKLQAKKAEVEHTVAEIKKLQNLQELKRETETAITNATHQLQLFIDKGVEEKLKQQTLFDRDVATLSGTLKTMSEFMNAIGEVIRNYQSSLTLVPEGSEFNKEFFVTAQQLLQELRDQMAEMHRAYERTTTINDKMRALLSDLNTKKEGLKEDFARIKREINIPTLNPDNFLALNRQIETAQLKLKEIQNSEARRTQWVNVLSERLTQYNNLMLEEFRLVEAEVTRINQAETKLDIEVVFKGRKDKFLSKMKDAFKGAYIQTYSYEAIADKYPDFIEIYRNPAGLGEILNENHVVEFKKRLWEKALELLTFQTENRFTIRYNGKPLKDHSLGQRASALILFLLAQKENDVLIIDQPEDDLDNQTIYEEVIKEIKRLKGQMQFIFATHNANIPVLGDSEKVVACTYIDNKEIAIQAGTIDDHETQEQIVRIMEGGKEAFSRRKSIYDIWKIESGES